MLEKKTAIIIGFLVSASFFVIGSYVLYVKTTLSDFNNLLLCANEEYKPPLLSSSICEIYLIKVHDNYEDISMLNESIGVSWALLSEKNYYNISLLSILIEKGVDINAIDRLSGLTALHAMVLEGDPKGVRILLKHGANVNVSALTPIRFGQEEVETPLELARVLYDRDGSEELRDIVSQLEVSAASLAQRG